MSDKPDELMDELDGYPAPWDAESGIPVPEDWEIEQALETAQEYLAVSPSQFVESTILVPDPESRQLVSYSYEQRPYLRQIYDCPQKRMLLMTGRQVEKTLVLGTQVSLVNGSTKAIELIRIGDRLVGFDETANTLHPGEVSWVSQIYRKPCVRITTRQGHIVEAGTTHPFRRYAEWAPASALHVGDRLAVIRRGGWFGSTTQHVSRIVLTALLIGDGSIGTGQLSFTNTKNDLLTFFKKSLDLIGERHSTYEKRNTKTTAYVVKASTAKTSPLRAWLEEDGLWGKKSADKFIPSWVFDLPKEETALFLQSLWATDGHVKQLDHHKWDLVYGSISRSLVEGIQRLLWKFGIPSKIRVTWPSLYKKRGERKFAYLLRIETQNGIRSFIEEIGAFGKVDRQVLPAWEGNPNRDTVPFEVNAVIAALYGRLETRTRALKTRPRLTDFGLAKLPKKYSLTEEKLSRWVEFFKACKLTDEELFPLTKFLNQDVYWDTIETIEDIGEQDCIDLTVETYHSFIANGFVTHNSTLLGNRMLALSCLYPNFKSLYVSPSSQQTKDFSKARLKEPMETCPDLKVWFPSEMTDNVFEKQGINRSTIKLRYAFLTADRVRGNSADLIALDEFQDILLDNVPVIEESASHSPYKIFMYSGTPKSLDNPIQYYWDRFSTKNEWAVPCRHHGTPKDKGTWHWNILGEKNIGADGLICDKCGRRIHPNDPEATWVRTGEPDRKKDWFEGFRIPQLMVPWMPWSEILTKYSHYPRAKFFNEVLGFSFDSGQRPVTRSDVMSNCDSDMHLDSDYVKTALKKIGNQKIYVGVDWGQDSTNSYTIIALGAYFDGFFRIFFIHRFQGTESEPKEQIKKIKNIIHTFRASRIGADYGGGFWPNDELLREFGSDRVVRYQYSTPSEFVRWDPKIGRFLVHRSEVMSTIFNAIKRANVFRFPRWTDFASPFASDILSIFSEYDEKRRTTQYKKSPNSTDDSFHAILFCFLASLIDYPRPDVLVPNQKIDQHLREMGEGALIES